MYTYTRMYVVSFSRPKFASRMSIRRYVPGALLVVRVYSHFGGLGVIVRSPGTLASFHDTPSHLLVGAVYPGGCKQRYATMHTYVGRHQPPQDVETMGREGENYVMNSKQKNAQRMVKPDFLGLCGRDPRSQLGTTTTTTTTSGHKETRTGSEDPRKAFCFPQTACRTLQTSPSLLLY